MKNEQNKVPSTDGRMALTPRNYVLMLIGFAVIVLGFVLMAGGGSESPEEFNYAMFNFRRITLAPILVIGGFAFEIYAIMKRFGGDKAKEE
ncbi:MAG: DUF3098 domain-containing protein [Rikenellaceae bacterium]|nr:DUF3098 domain-containing protein [Rikenellaceae bacterium]